jgi:cullin-associated NEDD8-dissociated protein 1
MGVIIEPIVAADVNNRTTTRRVPDALFSHNGMQRHLASLDPENGAAKGVLGRITESLTTKVDPPFAAGVYSMAGTRKIVESSIAPTFVSPREGVPRYNMYTELVGTIDAMVGSRSHSVFGDTYAGHLASTLTQSESVGALLDETEPETPVESSNALRQIAKVIKARESLEAERDVFILSINNFDTHFDLDHTERFGEVDDVIADFEAEMKAQGVWDDVVMLTVSDFGRTLTVNGGGTDHAWGGNYFVLGGGIKGGQVHGSFPSSLAEDADLILGRGRVVPTLPYEGVWRALCEWFGVPAADLARILPNLENFPTDLHITQEQLFE